MSLMFLLLCLPNTSGAEDLKTDNQTWNGHSTLARLVENQGFFVTSPKAINWDNINLDDVLLISYPTAKNTPWEELFAFVFHGGQLILLDDFGSAGPFFSLMGLEKSGRTLTAPKGTSPFPDTPKAFRANTEHLLTADTAELWTNKPTSFLNATNGVLYQFDEHNALVIEKKIGKGRVVAIADASLFINRMLELDENFAFAKAIIASLGETTQKVFFFDHQFKVKGKAHPLPTHEQYPPYGFRTKTALNESLRDLSDYWITKQYASLIAAILTLLLVLYVLTHSRLTPHKQEESIESKTLQARVKKTLLLRFLQSNPKVALTIGNKEALYSRVTQAGIPLSKKEKAMLTKLFQLDSRKKSTQDKPSTSFQPLSDWHRLLQKISSR